MKAYRVMTPSDVIADGIWRQKEDIPSRVPDRFERYFDSKETETFEVDVTETEFDRIRESSGCKDRY